MSNQKPLVSIGIPTFNRGLLVGRAIDSALSQDYPLVEVIVSDNASTDGTEQVCRERAAIEPRLRYVKQSSNIGATRNFETVLESASGQFFMWLGDDDWIDSNYVRLCLAHLIEYPETALASGTAKYYEHGKHAGQGLIVTLPQLAWWRRVIAFFWRVRDNGIFYGLARTDVLRRQLPFRNVMAGDWLHVAALASQGSIWTVESTYIHRELGGATASYAKIARSLGLSRAAGQFPFSFVAWGAFAEIAWRHRGFDYHSPAVRGLVATLVSGILLLRGLRVAIGLYSAPLRRWRTRLITQTKSD